jgi:hypothetical protein
MVMYLKTPSLRDLESQRDMLVQVARAQINEVPIFI